MRWIARNKGYSLVLGLPGQAGMALQAASSLGDICPLSRDRWSSGGPAEERHGIPPSQMRQCFLKP